MWKLWSRVSRLRSSDMGGPKSVTYREWMEICEGHDLTLDDLNKLLLLEEIMLPVIREHISKELEGK